MAWFVSRRNCPSFLTANTVAGPLDRAHRSGPADSDHQDPATTVLLPRRTAHPLGAPPHFASSPALALGKPVQWRPGTIASAASPGLTAPLAPDPSTRLPNHLEDSRQVGPLASLAACCPDHLAQHHHRGPPTSPWRGYRTLHSANLLESSPHGSFPCLTSLV